MLKTLFPRLLAAAAAVALFACSDSGGTGTGGGGAATQLDSLASGTAAPGGTITLKVIARDAQGRPAVGTTVHWSVVAGGGTVPAQSVTGGDGIATAAWQTGTTGTQQALARIDAGAQVVFSRASQAAPVNTFTAENDGQVGPESTYLPRLVSVHVRDPQGKDVAGYPTFWTVHTQYFGDSVRTKEIITGSDGRASWELFLAGPGPYTLDVGVPDIHGDTIARFHLTATAVTGPPNGLVATRDTLRGAPGQNPLAYAGEGPYLTATRYDAAGHGTPTSDYGLIDARLLDNTGAIQIAKVGTNAGSGAHWAVTLVKAGTEHVELKRLDNGAADTVTVIVRP